MSQLDRTIWRDVEILRPAEWELSVASPAGQAGQCAFSDRYWQRLDVMWRRPPAPPNIDLLLEKFRHEHLRRMKDNPDDDLTPLTGAPNDWRGFRQLRRGSVLTRALRFDPVEKLVFELAVFWPDRLNADLERELMVGLRPVPADRPERHWRAMGMDVQLDRAYDLSVYKPLAGKIHWEFQPPGSDSRRLYVERVAMPGFLIKTALADWLPRQVPVDAMVLNQRAISVNDHRGQEVLSRSKVGRFGSWRGRHHVRLERAWVCPSEQRLYRVCLTELTRDETVAFPTGLNVRCCQPSPAIPVPSTGPSRRSRLAAEGGAKTTEQFLDAVAIVNQAATIEPRPDGGAMASVAMNRPGWLIPPISWLLPMGTHRRIQLDAIGCGVLAVCDGKRSVEKVVEIFAATHKLTFREAQLPATQYLRQLAQRGIVVIVGLKADS